MMRLAVELGEEAVALLVPAIIEAAKKEGLLVAAYESEDPLTVEECARRGKISDTQVRRMVGAGTFKRVPGTGRVLIEAGSFKKWRAAK
jgi:hypothetical protein